MLVVAPVHLLPTREALLSRTRSGGGTFDRNLLTDLLTDRHQLRSLMLHQFRRSALNVDAGL